MVKYRRQICVKMVMINKTSQLINCEIDYTCCESRSRNSMTEQVKLRTQVLVVFHADQETA